VRKRLSAAQDLVSKVWSAANLNNSGAPYWDAATANYLGNPTSRNVGFCLTSSGDCQGINSPLFAPGPIPFWGTAYNSAADTGGARDLLVYFKSNGSRLKATLQLNLGSTPKDINEFGWFETNATGTTLGATHKLYQGAGDPQGSLVPDPVGKVVIFTPTQYFGFYFKDVSENGCLVSSIASFTSPNCCSDHLFAVFATHPGQHDNVFEIAGLDPPTCTPDDDCNLTLVKIERFECPAVPRTQDRWNFYLFAARSMMTVSNVVA
jgi:hypothetical protein